MKYGIIYTKPLCFFVLLVFLFLFTGCALHGSSTNHYFPVRNHESRKSSLGFSIKPPSGPGWYEKLNNKSLYYVKKLPSTDYSIYTKATELHVNQTALHQESFLRFVKRRKNLDRSSGRYRNITSRYTVAREISPLCVRYSQAYDDLRDGKRPDKLYVRVNTQGLMCMHPRRPESGVDMFYVESYLPDKRTVIPPLFQQEAEYFLKSLEFDPRGS